MAISEIDRSHLRDNVIREGDADSVISINARALLDLADGLRDLAQTLTGHAETEAGPGRARALRELVEALDGSHGHVAALECVSVAIDAAAELEAPEPAEV